MNPEQHLNASERRPSEIHWEWVGGLPFWQAIAQAIPIDVVLAGKDAEDEWVRLRWQEAVNV